MEEWKSGKMEEWKSGKLGWTKSLLASKTSLGFRQAATSNSDNSLA